MDINRFQEKLNEQLIFMLTSCQNYDRGQTIEALRISIILRMLFHNTRRSTSLLKHLGKEQVPILSTCPVRESISNGRAFDGLTGISEAGIEPKLGPSATDIELPAADWWQQSVLSLGVGSILSRKDIVLDTADKDGGAHVDDKLPQAYMNLMDGVWVSSTGGSRYSNHHYPCLRQMGYEVLKSPKLLAIAHYKSQSDHLKEAVPARQEKVFFTNFEAGSISPEEKKNLLKEVDEFKAKEAPILVPSDETRYSSPCPFCKKQTPTDSSPIPPCIVEGELPLTDEEKWVYCQGETRHLLLIQRVPE